MMTTRSHKPARHDAFGNLTSSSGGWQGPFGYAGKFGYQSSSILGTSTPDDGLKLLGHRYYDPSTGRFLTRDPIKDGRNWFVYCENDPVKSVDPRGLYPGAYDPSDESKSALWRFYVDVATYVTIGGHGALPGGAGAGIANTLGSGAYAAASGLVQVGGWRRRMEGILADDPAAYDFSINPWDLPNYSAGEYINPDHASGTTTPVTDAIRDRTAMTIEALL